MTTTSVGIHVLVLHAHWSESRLKIWAESSAHWSAAQQPSVGSDPAGAVMHFFATGHEELLDVLGRCGVEIQGRAGEITLRLPVGDDRSVPMTSPRLAHALGHLTEDPGQDLSPELRAFAAPCVEIQAGAALEVLDAIEDLASADDERFAGIDETSTQAGVDAASLNDGASPGEVRGAVRVMIDSGVSYLAAVGRFVRHLLSQQRFVPMILQDAGGGLLGRWQVWLADEATSKKLGVLMSAMPPASRSVIDGYRHDGWSMLEAFMHENADALVRSVFAKETLHDAIEGRDPHADAHVAWLTGLLTEPVLSTGEQAAARADDGARIQTSTKLKPELVKGARRWIGGLDDRGVGAAWRLLLSLAEPLDLSGITQMGVPGDSVRWTLTLMLQHATDPRVRVEAEEIWSLPGGGTGAANIQGHRIDAPGEVLLAELGRAARLYKKLEGVLNDPEPSTLELNTSEVYKFLREIKPILLEQGFGVEAPEWWDQPSIRLGARMIVESPEVDLSDWMRGVAGAAGAAGNAPTIGLSSLVNYRWQIAVGDTTLTLEQFERLAAQHSPLILLNGKWVEIRPDDVKAAMRFIRENPGGTMEVGKALRLAYASDSQETGVPILGMDATGWVATVFGDAATNVKLPLLQAPRGFVGTLRPYQLKGLSWLAFLDRFGLGACLADDMGLGKTVQLLALLAHESELRKEIEAAGGRSTTGGEGPTLLIVPMSVVPNWVHEAKRFTPDLKVLVHHGPERLSGQRLFDEALAHDMLVTTYALAHRDREDLAKVPWGRVVLDEAQNIKNPSAKQTRAIREIESPRRFALTGTPVENRLGELWSIMDFLNPGYLGSTGEFRRKFSLPIERYHDRHKSSQLRGLVQPFVLRRLKSDPNVISDLPEKVESKEYCYLTPEQANLYQSAVKDMLSAADKSQGIQRRGVVLAGLIKLKQICNHPAQFLKEWSHHSSVNNVKLEASTYAEAGPDSEESAVEPTPIGAGGAGGGGGGGVPVLNRSGKVLRLVEMLEEVVAAGDKALVFTQFRQMGYLLAAMLRQALEREVLFLHGGTSTNERQRLINLFQGSGGAAQSSAPIFILSLKAGGVGLNLTAANHVFHFDRWWNPAVEAQATDRAYRIGQTRTVQVHKFVTAGTLEERIDQMIESKMELAQEVIGSGEDWLTEMSTTQLRDMLTLRTDAVGEVGG